MTKQLNGWRRLYIVVIGLGLLYGIWFALDDASKQYDLEGGVLLGFSRVECAAVVQMLAGTKLNPEPNYGSGCWDLYLYRSIYKDARDTTDGYVEHRNSLQRKRILENLFFVSIVWVLGASLLYGIGATVAWVVRGFRSNAA